MKVKLYFGRYGLSVYCADCGAYMDRGSDGRDETVFVHPEIKKPMFFGSPKLINCPHVGKRVLNTVQFVTLPEL
jgi:hypothetical protein